MAPFYDLFPLEMFTGIAQPLNMLRSGSKLAHLIRHKIYSIKTINGCNLKYLSKQDTTQNYAYTCLIICSELIEELQGVFGASPVELESWTNITNHGIIA